MEPRRVGHIYTRSRALAAIIALCLMLPTALWAAPPAGTVIENQASADYTDPDTGVTQSVVSNVVTVEVQAQEALTLEADRQVEANRASTVVMPHRLTNTGNVQSTYRLTVSNQSGDQYDLSALQLIHDLNGNGQVDQGEPTLLPTDDITLDYGQYTDLLVVGVVPSSVANGQVARVVISATTQLQSLSAQNTDTVTALAPVALDIIKSATPQDPQAGEEVTYNLTARNIGGAAPTPIIVQVDGADASVVLVSDAMPANTVFVRATDPGGGSLLYHRLGAARHVYTTMPPQDPAQVDEIAYGLPELQPGATFSFSFTVQVGRSTGVQMDNIAYITYMDDLSAQEVMVPSNILSLALTPVAPDIEYYTDLTFTDLTSVTGLGSDLYVQAECGAANKSAAAIETAIISITSSLTGDSESYTGTESGPNTGLFRIIPPVPTTEAPGASTAQAAPVIGNGTVETLSNDVLTARIDYEGQSATDQIVVDPYNVVFDSHTDQVIAGATVTLIDVTGAGNGGDAGGPAKVWAPDGTAEAPSTVVTGTDGRFAFARVNASTYRVEVTPPEGYTFPTSLAPAQLPTTRTIDADGSYGREVVVAAALGTVRFDLPVDAPPPTGLFIEKTASRNSVEVGDFLDYRVRIRNTNTVPLTDVVVHDRLAKGFRYRPGSTKVDGIAAADPEGGVGPQARFAIGAMDVDQEIELTYRVEVGIGALEGDGTNRAVARGRSAYGPVTSNTATATVAVRQGVLTDRGIIFGKIFIDANHSRVQDADEIGIPGVRLYLEDGTYVVSDSEGKYSIYGARPTTHVLRVDLTTLPPGAVLSPITQQHARDGASCFVDLKKGEMHKANFAETSASPEVLENVKARRQKAEVSKAEVERSLTQTMSPDGEPNRPSDARSRPAAGIIGGGDEKAIFEPIVSKDELEAANPAPPNAPGTQAPALTLDKAMAGLDNTLGFIDLHDADTLPATQVTVRVKGPLGSSFKLQVNGRPVPDTRVGAKAVLAQAKLEAWEFVAVDLQPGGNDLTVTVLDGFGNERGQATITVVAPGNLGKILLTVPDKVVAADGRGLVPVKVSLTDDNDVPVSARTLLTLEAERGEWQTPDLNPDEPGTQVFIQGGEATYELKAPDEPGDSKVRVTSGVLEAQTTIGFVPDLRDPIAIGLIDITAALHSRTGAATRAHAPDPFEQELRYWSTRGENEDLVIGGRTALMYKGAVRGDYLLTLSYDSEKRENETLFRDIEPDEYYPVYGDSSIRGYDAQSTGKLYVRVDKGKSYAMYGDFTTRTDDPARSLGSYYRSLTGPKVHYETGKTMLDIYASNDNARQVVEELRANGTSGPYYLGHTPTRSYSEYVELIVRDRNQPSLILSTEAQTRFSDYEVEPVSGRILFRVPISSYDQNLNPVYIRVTYEVETNGPTFWVMGMDAAFRLSDKLQIGGSWMRDQDPEDPTTLTSINASLKLGPKTTLIAEVAQTDTESRGIGRGSRVELNHQGDKLRLRAYAGGTDPTFENPTSMLNRGRRESGLKAGYQLDPKTRLSAEYIHSKDAESTGTLDGYQLSVERALSRELKLELGMRHAKETDVPSQPSIIGSEPADFTSLRAKATYQPQGMPRGSFSAEYEQDVSESSKRVLALGGEYQLGNRSRLYARHEFLSSIGGRYLLEPTNSQSTSLIGIDADYMKDGRLFSEYRARDAFSGRDAEAAIGLRNRFQLRDGLTLNASVERITGLEGTALNDGTAITGAVEWTSDPLWVGNMRAEMRHGTQSDSFLGSVGLARKMSDDWTFLGRYLLSDIRGKGRAGDRRQARLRLGLAYRDTDTDVLSGLVRYEILADYDDTLSGLTSDRLVHIWSADVNYQPDPRLLLSLHYAGKRVKDNSNGFPSTYSASLLSGRVSYELDDRISLGILASTLVDDHGQQWGMGAELGYLVAEDILLSAGYNFSGFRDDDLSGEEYTDRGPYIRLRYKFGESLVGGPKARQATAERTQQLTQAPTSEAPEVTAAITGVSGAE